MVYQPLISGSYLGLIRSISWLLMPWLLVSPGHLQPWYWLCRIGRPLSYLRKDFNYLCHVIFNEWHKMQIYVYVPFEKFSTQRVNIITSAMAKVMFSSLSVTRVCLSVSLSVSNIMEKRLYGFSWNFQSWWDLVQGTIGNIFRIFNLTPWTQDFFFHFFGGIHAS